MEFITSNWVTFLVITLILVAYKLVPMRNGNRAQAGRRKETIQDYKGKYKRCDVLTQNEQNQFSRIKNTTNRLNLNLFVKVRLADIIEPVRGQKEWKTLFYKIQAKHVDFLICTQNFKTICVLEIDDNSHERKDRKKRDEFVDTILNDVGITTIRKRDIVESELYNEVKKIADNRKISI